jgi:predicted nucleic acid-binding protein
MKSLRLILGIHLLAATALVHGLKIATRNVEDFAASGVPILNPWK